MYLQLTGKEGEDNNSTQPVRWQLMPTVTVAKTINLETIKTSIYAIS